MLLGLLTESLFQKTQKLDTAGWNSSFAEEIYLHIASRQVYISNLASCTQLDARPLSDAVYRSYRDLALQEMALVDPKHIVSFGNQVSSVLLQKQISVSRYKDIDAESLDIEGKPYPMYPTYYPVGQGQRNMPLAVERIQAILANAAS